MPRIDITDLDKDLRQGRISPIYIIVGTEHFLTHAALKMVRGAVEEGGTDLATKVVSGKEARAEVVLGALRTVPMLGGRPMVIIREGEAVPKATLDALADYAERPLESATLVIVADKLDGRSRFMQLASKNGAVLEAKPLYMDKVPQWINMEVKKSGRQISLDAAKFLADMVGSDLGPLSQAIERVILYVGDRKTIDTKDIEESIAETHQHTVFELTDAVGLRLMPKAISLLHNVLEGGESPILVLNMLARHLRILSKAKEITGRMDPKEIAKYLGVHPFFAKNYLGQARGFSKGELKAGFKILSRCDRELKSSRLPKERVIERALFELIK